MQVSVTGTHWLRANRSFAAGDLITFEMPRFYVPVDTSKLTRCALSDDDEWPVERDPADDAVYLLALQAFKGLATWTSYSAYSHAQSSRAFSVQRAREACPGLAASELRAFEGVFAVMLACQIKCYVNGQCTGVGFYDTLSHLNHSCLDANCTLGTAKDGRCMRLIAQTTICAGDELTISYCAFAANTPTFERRRAILELFGFYCTCRACSDDCECAYCGCELRRKLRRCTYCHQVNYCSSECRDFDWHNGTHRSTCAALRAYSQVKHAARPTTANQL